jgi:hypothetical protein
MSPRKISSFKPLPEQELARRLFLKEEGLRLDAYAGTGKTTTLHYLAESTAKSGLYLAFNRAIAKEAQARFPSRVSCATTHSIAFRQVRRRFDYPDWKLTGAITPNVIANAFRFPTSISFACRSLGHCGTISESGSFSRTESWNCPLRCQCC